jgi:hypothetical protein
MRSDRGSVTVWVLGLAVLLLLFGGLALDFWRALAVQRELAAVADSAVVAAASGIDEEAYRDSGIVVLDPVRAADLAGQSISSQDVELVEATTSVAPDGLSVEVVLAAELELGLLGVFVDQAEPLLIRATAFAEPRLVP